MEKIHLQKLSDFLDWVELTKAPPGPPPRPGLEWRDRTSRWIRPETGATVVEGSPSSKDMDDAGIHIHTPIDLDPSQAMDLVSQIKEFEDVFTSVMLSLNELFTEGEVSGRMKTLESVSEKITRRGYSSLADLTDVVGTRIEFSDVDDIREAVGEVRRRFTVLEEEFHHQKDGYYTATHFIIEVNSKPVEIQFRTVANGKIAAYAHDVVYKHASDFTQDFGLIDQCNSYLRQWSSFIEGFSEFEPICPDSIRLVIGCLEDLIRPRGVPHTQKRQEMQGGEIAAMIEKELGDDFKTKVFELIHKITAPKGKYRVVEVDEFVDPFETGILINDFVFLEEAQQERDSMQQQNPTVKYFIYDEDSKVVK